MGTASDSEYSEGCFQLPSKLDIDKYHHHIRIMEKMLVELSMIHEKLSNSLGLGYNTLTLGSLVHYLKRRTLGFAGRIFGVSLFLNCVAPSSMSSYRARTLAARIISAVHLCV